jgi:hypothetical protein
MGECEWYDFVVDPHLSLIEALRKRTDSAVSEGRIELHANPPNIILTTNILK